MGRMWWVVLCVMALVGACRSNAATPAHRTEAKTPCKAKAALKVFARFQAGTMDKIGASGKGLYTGTPSVEKLRDLATVLRRGGKALAGFQTRDAGIDELLHKRANLFLDMAHLFDQMSTAKGAHDRRGVERAREALFAKRAVELGLRKDLRRRFAACGLKPPI